MDGKFQLDGRVVVRVRLGTHQHRIVAKVDELMALCDQLEAQLAATRLLEAVLRDALEVAV